MKTQNGTVIAVRNLVKQYPGVKDVELVYLVLSAVL